MKNHFLKQLGLLALVLCVAGAYFPQDAQAVPNFARKTGLTCASCHSNMPKLNAFGREFFRNGYVRTGEREPQFELSETAFLDKHLLGLYAKMRPYDKKRSGHAKIRSFHELEIFLAGTSGPVLGNNVSFYTEIEAEDETNFELEVGSFELGYHFMPEVNVVMGNRSLAETDPFQTISNHGKTTRSSRAIFSNTFGSGNNLGAKQNVGLYGTAIDSIFYGAKVGADVGDPEGEGEEDVAVRLAYMFPWIEKALSAGAYWSTGSQLNEDEDTGAITELDFNRLIFDFMFDHKMGSFLFAYQMTEDDLLAGGEEDNNGFYAEAAYYFLRDGNPFIVPTVRWDEYEKTDGTQDWSELTVNLAVYIRENMKAFVEYWREIDIPGNEEKNNRWTIQVEIGL